MLVNCKSCGKEIAKGVKKCVNCGADQRNFFSRHKILTGILALAIIIGIGSAMGSGGSSTATAPSTSTPAIASTPTKPVVAELSKEGVSNDVKIVVTSFTSKDSVGDNQYNTAKAQGIFKLVGMNIVNNQKDAITISSGSFKLIDDQDREFSSSSEGSIALGLSSNKTETFLLKQLNPGMSIDGVIVFDVPKDAKGFKLKASGGITGKVITLKVE